MPHVGYVTEDLYRAFYGDAAANIARWFDVNATSAYLAATSKTSHQTTKAYNHERDQ
jgi:hypothetical protein